MEGNRDTSMKGERSTLLNLFFSLRPTHWIKNLIVFLPLIFGFQLMTPKGILMACLAFIVFSLAASAGYLLNDVKDRGHDQQHPLKRLRPFARGNLNRPILLLISGLLFLSSLGMAVYLVNLQFFMVILAYLLLNVAYTFVLKHLVIIDVMTLSAFYILRVLGGLVAVNVRISHWMIICIGLLALFIGFNKRRQEIKFLGQDAPGHRSVLNQYGQYFIDQMIGIVTAATVVSYSVFTVDPETVARFGTRGLLLTIPFVYYGIFRYLYLVHKVGHGGDPVRIFLLDKVMILNLIGWVLTSIAVIYL